MGYGTTLTSLEVTPANIDDIFRELNLIGLEEIEVDRHEMNVICHFLLANQGDNFIYDTSKGAKMWHGSYENVLRENTTDRFMGIDVKLSEV